MLKIGVFGVGHLGKFHLNNWKEIPVLSSLAFMIPMMILPKKFPKNTNYPVSLIPMH